MYEIILIYYIYLTKMTEVNMSATAEEMSTSVGKMSATVDEMSTTVKEMSATVEKVNVIENLKLKIFIHNSAWITSKDTWNNL